MLTIKRGEWVVVCDGRKALILENAGNAVETSLKTIEGREYKAPPTSALGADAPGRVRASVGTAQSAVEQTDWHDQAERTFLKEIAERLDQALEAGETQSLILIAPPRALGMLRPLYSPAIKKALKTEIAKDYVSMPVSEIEKRLAA